MYLPKETLPAADAFMRSTLWPQIESVLKQRIPVQPSPDDTPTSQIARSFMRQGYEKCLDDLRNMAYQQVESPPEDPFRAALDPRD